MKIVTWSSTDAPESHKWCARYMVPVRQNKKQSDKEGRDGPHAIDPAHEAMGNGKPDRMGFLPIVLYAPTKELVVAKAESVWASKIAFRAKMAAGSAKRAAASAQSRKKAS